MHTKTKTTTDFVIASKLMIQTFLTSLCDISVVLIIYYQLTLSGLNTPRHLLLANSADPARMLHTAAFHPHVYCLLKTKSNFRKRNTI